MGELVCVGGHLKQWKERPKMILNPCVYEMRFGLYIVNLAFGMLAAHYTLEKMNEVSTTIVLWHFTG